VDIPDELIKLAQDSERARIAFRQGRGNNRAWADAANAFLSAVEEHARQACVDRRELEMAAKHAARGPAGG